MKSMIMLFQANRDPHKLHWLFEILIKNPLEGNSGSFKDSRHVYSDWLIAVIIEVLFFAVGYTCFSLPLLSKSGECLDCCNRLWNTLILTLLTPSKMFGRASDRKLQYICT